MNFQLVSAHLPFHQAVWFWCAFNLLISKSRSVKFKCSLSNTKFNRSNRWSIPHTFTHFTHATPPFTLPPSANKPHKPFRGLPLSPKTFPRNTQHAYTAYPHIPHLHFTSDHQPVPLLLSHKRYPLKPALPRNPNKKSRNMLLRSAAALSQGSHHPR